MVRLLYYSDGQTTCLFLWSDYLPILIVRLFANSDGQTTCLFLWSDYSPISLAYLYGKTTCYIHVSKTYWLYLPLVRPFGCSHRKTYMYHICPTEPLKTYMYVHVLLYIFCIMISVSGQEHFFCADKTPRISDADLG